MRPTIFSLALVAAVLMPRTIEAQQAGGGPPGVAEPPTAFLLRIPVPPPAAELRTGSAEPLVAELRIPEGAGPFPVVILVHGGCLLSRWGNRGAYLRPMAEALRTQHGVATWLVRYRGVDEAGGGWPGTFQDLAAATDSLRTMAARYPLDTTRVAVVGHSAGSMLAAWIAARPHMQSADPEAGAIRGRVPLAVRSVVNVDGWETLTVAHADTNPVCGHQQVEALLGGSVERHPARWRAAAAERWLGDDASVRRLLVTDVPHHFSILDPRTDGWRLVRDAVLAALADRD